MPATSATVVGGCAETAETPARAMMDATEIAVRRLGQLRHREQNQWKKISHLVGDCVPV
jgi:hypothetical protein